MSTTTEDRRERLAEHREALESAKAAIFDSPTVEDEFGEIQSTYAALEALAAVSLELWWMAVITEAPNRQVGEGELPHRRVQAIAPMKEDVAKAVLAHGDRLEALRSTMLHEVCDLEGAAEGLARALAGYGEDVPFPVLEALKELDVGGEGVGS